MPEVFVCLAGSINLGDKVGLRHLILHHTDVRIAVGFECLFFLQGDDKRSTRCIVHIAKTGRKARQELALFLLNLLVGLVDREVELGGNQLIAPWFTDLEMVAERGGITREERYHKGSEQCKDSNAKDVFRQSATKLLLFHKQEPILFCLQRYNFLCNYTSLRPINMPFCLIEH